MGMTIDLFKKIRDTKGLFHAKVGTIKDRQDPALAFSVVPQIHAGERDPSGALASWF